MKTNNVMVKSLSESTIQPTTYFVQAANEFESQIWVVQGDRCVNAKSMLGLLVMDLNPGSEVMLKAEGPDEDEAIKTLSERIGN